MGETRKIAAILCSDVVGYSRLAGADEDRILARLRALRSDLIDPTIAVHKGRIVKRTGDGSLIDFRSVVDAVRCAIEVQNAMVERNAGVPEDRRIAFRIGIHLGDVVEESDGDLMGDGVNIAARLQQIAAPGAICLSEDAYRQVKGRLDLAVTDLGQTRLKNIAEPIRTYSLQVGIPAEAKPAAPRKRFTLIPLAAGIAVLLIVIAAGAWYFLGGTRPALAAPSIAVLPFENLSGDPANGRLADGITEDIITDLSRYRDFTVIARDSTFVYKGKPVDVRQVGRDLNVSHVLEGSFQRDGGDVRITAQLIDAATGTHIWSERYDRPAEQVFAVQSELADRIANSLAGFGGKIFGSIVTAAKRKRPGDLGAYELYLLGLEKMYSAPGDAAQLEARRLIEHAIDLDPTLAQAHTSLAWNYSWRAALEADSTTLYGNMLAEARRAVDLDPSDADAHAAFGWAQGKLGDLPQAENEYDEALRLNPHSFSTLTTYACWAGAFGKAKQGVEAEDEAMRLNPNYPNWAIDCFRTAFLYAGRNEDVLKISAKRPESNWGPFDYVGIAGGLAELGRPDEARAAAARGVAKFPALLSIEKFAFNGPFTPSTRAWWGDLMRKAGFPACASDQDLAGIAKPQRLPECVKS